MSLMPLPDFIVRALFANVAQVFCGLGRYCFLLKKKAIHLLFRVPHLFLREFSFQNAQKKCDAQKTHHIFVRKLDFESEPTVSCLDIGLLTHWRSIATRAFTA